MKNFLLILLLTFGTSYSQQKDFCDNLNQTINSLFKNEEFNKLIQFEDSSRRVYNFIAETGCLFGNDIFKISSYEDFSKTYSNGEISKHIIFITNFQTDQTNVYISVFYPFESKVMRYTLDIKTKKIKTVGKPKR